jgi:outer membrane usher protein FimD/PapC
MWCESETGCVDREWGLRKGKFCVGYHKELRKSNMVFTINCQQSKIQHSAYCVLGANISIPFSCGKSAESIEQVDRVAKSSLKILLSSLVFS